MKKSEEVKKFVFLTDLHLTPKYRFGGEKYWLEVSLDALRLAKALSEKNDAPIIFLGDLFQIPDPHPAWLVNTVRKEVRGVESYFLLGNHDIGNRGSSIVNVLEDIDGVTVVDEPKALEINGVNCAFIPYLDSYEETAERAEEMAGAELLFMHHGLEGAVNGLGYTFPEGVSKESLSGYEFVFCGHYHKHQQVFNNAWYLGSPFQLDFGERGDNKKGVWLFDYLGEKLTQYEIPNAPQFYHFEFDGLDDFSVDDLLDDYENAFIKLVFNVTKGESIAIDKRKITKDLKSRGARGVIVNTKIIKDDVREGLNIKGGKKKNWEEIIKAWGEKKELDDEELKVGLDILRSVDRGD